MQHNSDAAISDLNTREGQIQSLHDWYFHEKRHEISTQQEKSNEGHGLLISFVG